MTRTEAINLLFETSPAVLSRETVQQAFIRKVKAIHPDLNPNQNTMRSRLLVPRLKEARDLLRQGEWRTHPGLQERPKTRDGFADKVNNSGWVPKRRLRLGQYLYYTGKITWRTLIEAVIDQKSLRPGLGELAIARGMIEVSDRNRLVIERRAGEFIGETAVRLGMLTAAQVSSLLSAQEKYAGKIGGVFVRRGILTNGELLRALVDLKRHNAKYPA